MLASKVHSSPLSTTQIEQFYERGWIILENLFEESELQRLRSSFDSLKLMAELLKTTQTSQGSHFVLNQKNGETVIQRIVWAGGAAPYLAEISADPRLIDPAAQLLGSQEMDQLLNQAHFKMPGDGVSFDWHQDIQHRDKGPGTWTDVNGRGSYVQSILLVDDMTQDNGPLMFIPGSSQWGRLDLESENDDFAENLIHEKKAVKVLGRAGSVLFFGPYSVHGSFANNSQFPRRILINGYASPGANHRIYPGKDSGRRLVSRQTVRNS